LILSQYIKKLVDNNVKTIVADDNNVRDFATIGACCSAIEGDADILRVHNVKAVNSAITVFKKLSN
jgi:dihydropteroate synthase